jgi:hypothetical protein
VDWIVARSQRLIRPDQHVAWRGARRVDADRVLRVVTADAAIEAAASRP